MKTFGVDKALRAGILVLTLALVGVVASTLRDRLVVAGDSAPGFEVTTDTGRKISLDNFGGKVLVLNFWATWCPPCISELPSLNAMAAELKGNGVVVLGVSVDKDQAAYQRFLKKVKLNFETSRDPKADISSEYGTFKYPETYVINTDGKVLEKFIADQDWMSPAIVARLRGYAK
ncbi:MAG: TlpA family protein disulfide reductase [Bryobacterales bacterium]|nr:TlpA family protein disulfide reductase [Bryobacterales bacterium]